MELPATRHYFFDDGVITPAGDFLAWAMWFEKADRRVAQTFIGGVHISTVFLGLDHSFGSGPPILFETMIFGAEVGDELDQYQERYAGLEQAMAGHERAVAAVRAQLARQGPIITWLLRVRGRVRAIIRRVQMRRFVKQMMGQGNNS